MSIDVISYDDVLDIIEEELYGYDDESSYDTGYRQAMETIRLRIELHIIHHRFPPRKLREQEDGE